MYQWFRPKQCFLFCRAFTDYRSGEAGFFDLALGSEFCTKDLYIVEKPVAAALGEGIDVMHTPGTLIVDFGADTVEISVLAQGGVVASRLLKIGGNTMDEVICESVKEKCSLLIGMKTAEALKLELGSALNTVSSHKNILGRDRLPGCLQRQPFLQNCLRTDSETSQAGCS